MKSVLLIAEGEKMVEGAFRFLDEWCLDEKIKIRCLIPDAIEYEKHLEIENFMTLSGVKERLQVHDTDKLVAEQSRIEKKVKQLAASHNYECTTYFWNTNIEEIISYATYSDLVLLSNSYHVENIDSLEEQRNFDRLTHEITTPMVIIPDHYQKVENLIFSYSGSPSDAIAIKGFIQLFGKAVENKKVQLLHAGASFSLEYEYNKSLLLTYLTGKFIDIEVEESTKQTSNVLDDLGREYDNPLVVMGAMGRSKLSMFFRPSTAKKIIHNGTIPVFISHS